MKWEHIRQQYPRRWVVIEALEAHTEGGNRILDRIALIATFADDWQPAWERYRSLHAAAPEREYYMLHTDREQLDIGVLDTFRRSVT